MMKLEQDIQHQFTDIITKQIKVKQPSEAHQVYSDLVFYRFDEVFENAFPRFRKLVSEKAWEKLIYAFIHQGATSTLIWQMSYEFRHFVVANNKLNIPYLEDLLYFEWIEIEIFMQAFPDLKEEPFSFEQAYTLSPNIRIQTLDYPVHHPEFDDDPEAFEIGEYTVLLYFHEKSGDVMYLEITLFMLELLNNLEQYNALSSQLDAMATSYEIAVDDIKEVIQESLESFLSNQILLPKET